MKITGAEFMDWYDNAFPEGYFWDSGDGAIPTHDDDDKWLLAASDTYDLDSIGYLVAEEGKPELFVETAIKRWRKTRDTEFFAVHVPKAKVDDFNAALAALGIKP